MEKYKCIIVEDEPLAVEILRDYINELPNLNLRAICYNAMEASAALAKERIHLMFLDIHLPRISGFDFLNTLKHPPHIIITTAYEQYALKGYEFEVVDYLMKPFEFSRFLSAVNKLANKTPPVQSSFEEIEVEQRPYLYFNVRKRQIKVYFDEILYIESRREYIQIYTVNDKIFTKMQISEIESQLPKKDFLRIHRSYIISISKIGAYSANKIEIGSIKIPIGRNYKEYVQAFV